MTQLNTHISTLLVRYANGEASPEEKRQLDAWGSLSAANRLWLEQFADLNWLQKQSAVHHTIDLDERSQTFWSMVDAHETQHASQSGQPGKLQFMPVLKWVAKAAAILLLVPAGAYFFLLPKNKINPTASLFNKTNATPAVVENTPPPAAPSITDYENNRPSVSGNMAINKKMKARSPVNIGTKPAEDDSIKTFYSNHTLAPNTTRYIQAANGGAANGLVNNLQVPAKGFSIIDLPDGSRVWLNAMTNFSYPTVFTGNKRQVTLLGEAYFDVMPNDSMPFRVVVNGVELETSGGRFNMNAYGNEPFKKITVLQGAVRVATGPLADTVYENQAARVEKYITVAPNADTQRATAWTNRQFLYKQDSLPVVINELARRYDLTIAGNIPSHALISYSGAWTETAEETLAAIQRENKNFHYTIAGRKLTLE